MAAGDQWNQIQRPLRQLLAGQAAERRKERLLLTWAEAMVRAGNFAGGAPPARADRHRVHRRAPGRPGRLSRGLLSRPCAASTSSLFHELETLTEKLAVSTPFAGSLSMLLAELALAGNRPGEAARLLGEAAVVREDARAPAPAARGRPARREARHGPGRLPGTGRTLATDRHGPHVARPFRRPALRSRWYAPAAERYRQLADQLASDQLEDWPCSARAMCRLHLSATDTTLRLDLLQQEAFAGHRGRCPRPHETHRPGVRRRPPAAPARRPPPTANWPAPRPWWRCAGGRVQARPGHRPHGRDHRGQRGPADDHAARVPLGRAAHRGRGPVARTAARAARRPGGAQGIPARPGARQPEPRLLRPRLADSALLLDMARAYAELGLTAEAAQTYRYLYEVSTEADRERIHLPLVQALFAAGSSCRWRSSRTATVRHPGGGRRRPWSSSRCAPSTKAASSTAPWPCSPPGDGTHNGTRPGAGAHPP